jgi:hypothetical protein
MLMINIALSPRGGAVASGIVVAAALATPKRRKSLYYPTILCDIKSTATDLATSGNAKCLKTNKKTVMYYIYI